MKRNKKRYKWTILEAVMIIHAPTKREKTLITLSIGMCGFMITNKINWMEVKHDTRSSLETG